MHKCQAQTDINPLASWTALGPEAKPGPPIIRSVYCDDAGTCMPPGQFCSAMQASQPGLTCWSTARAWLRQAARWRRWRCCRRTSSALDCYLLGRRCACAWPSYGHECQCMPEQQGTMRNKHSLSSWQACNEVSMHLCMTTDGAAARQASTGLPLAAAAGVLGLNWLTGAPAEFHCTASAWCAFTKLCRAMMTAFTAATHSSCHTPCSVRLVCRGSVKVLWPWWGWACNG